MSINLVNIYAPVPATERGKSIVVGGHPKGESITYACGRTVVIRNVKNPLKADIYYDHSHNTTVAKYSPSGFYIASGDVSGKIRIWDTVNAEHILKIELQPLSGAVRDIAWSGDSQRLVIVGEGNDKFGVPIIWDSGSTVGEISGHSKPINSCDFKQTRPFRVMTASEDFQSNWFEGPPFKFKKSNKDHDRFVNCVRFSPDGNLALTVGSDKRGFIYDGKTGDKVAEIEPAHKLGIYSCSWSPDSARFVTASADKTARIFTADGKCVQLFELGGEVENQQLGALWVGDEVLSFSLGGDISYLDPNGGVRRVIHGHNKFITALTFDRERQQLISASFDAKVVVWNAANGSTSLMNGKGHTNQIVGMAIHGDDLFTLGMDDSLRVSSLHRAEYGATIGLDTTPIDLSVGERSGIAVAITKASINVVRAGRLEKSLPAKWEPTAVAVSPDESHVAVGGNDKKIHVFSLPGLEEVYVLDQHRGPISALAYSPNSRYLASVDTAARDVMVWEGQNNKINGWVYHTAKVNCIAWAPDSLHLVTGSLDSSVYVWDVEKPASRITIKNAHPGGVNDVVFVDRNVFASAGQDCAIKTWTVNFH